MGSLVTVRRSRSKPTRPERPADAVDDVAGGHVAWIAAARNEHVVVTTLQREHRNLRALQPTRCRNREEHGLSSREDLRPVVVQLAPLDIRRGQHFDLTTTHRNTEESTLKGNRGEDNRVIRSPACTTGKPWTINDGDRRPAANRHALKRPATINESHPVPIR